jgi:hypothetical protein
MGCAKGETQKWRRAIGMLGTTHRLVTSHLAAVSVPLEYHESEHSGE